MSRDSTIPAVTVIEEISGITIYPEVVHFMTGVGSIINGVFTYTVPQQYLSYAIENNLYQQLMGQYPNGFVADNLWEYVDIIRSGADSSAPSKYSTWDSVTNTWVDPANILELEKNDTTLEVNALAGVKILAVYPLFLQHNLSRDVTSIEAITMFTYIDSIRAPCNVAKASIAIATTITEIRIAVTTFTDVLLTI